MSTTTANHVRRCKHYNREPRSPQPRTGRRATANHVRPNHYEPSMNQKNLSAILPVETGTANHVRPQTQRQNAPLVPQNFSVQVKGKRKKLLPQQRQFATVARLIAAASELLQANPSLDYASRKENLKLWAVEHGISYDSDSITKALDIGERRVSGTPRSSPSIAPAARAIIPIQEHAEPPVSFNDNLQRIAASKRFG